jgi:RIO kinase 1
MHVMRLWRVFAKVIFTLISNHGSIQHISRGFLLMENACRGRNPAVLYSDHPETIKDIKLNTYNSNSLSNAMDNESMSNELDIELEKYDYYEAMFDPLRANYRPGRHRKPRHKTRIHQAEAVVDIAEDTQGLEDGFVTTYHPSRHERGWLLDSLRGFYEQSLITDVLAIVRGGKEANVYRCAAHPSTGEDFLAVKVYRPRQSRSMSNDAVYRQGRTILMEDGRPVRSNDHRVMRAIGKKTSFGVQVSHTSWLLHEYITLQRMHAEGGAVPHPYATGDNAILMGYCGDGYLAAPTLSEVKLEQDEAHDAWTEVLRNVKLMLNLGLVHGDLSAYNILIWEGSITLIDFPQVVDIEKNNSAWSIFERDIIRTCDYFKRQGVRCHGRSLAEQLWGRYGVDYDLPSFAYED